MKPFSFSILITLLFSIVSCESIIDIGEDGLGNVLMMNAQLCSSDSTHVVILANNKPNGIFPVTEASIECYINDILVGKSSVVEEIRELPVSTIGQSGQGYSVLHFNACFMPGDKVRIAAKSDDMGCEAMVSVPSAPEILDVNVAKCETEADLESGIYKFDVTIDDIQGEINYYSIKLLDQSYVLVIKSNDNSTYRTGDILNKGIKEISINTTKEPLINSGAKTIGSFLEQGDSYFDNKLNLFTDYLFRDKSYKMTVYSKKGFNTKPETMENGEVFVAYNIATIRLISYSEEEYLYLTGYQFDNSIESGTFLTNDFIYPSNVTGGLGFVSICGCTDYDCLISSVQYDDSYLN